MVDPRCMLTDKVEFNINGAKYNAKKANAMLHPADITIEGITYSVCMMDINPVIDTPDNPMLTTYHVSALWHSNKTGALVDCSTNGGIIGADGCVIKHMDQFVNAEGIDNCATPACYCWGHHQL